MTDHFIVLDTTTNTEAYRGSGVLAQTILPPHLAGFLVPYSVWGFSPTDELEEPNLTASRQCFIDQVNDQAAAQRRLRITAITGQGSAYAAKETEARAWVVGSDPDDFPYLREEASATGQSIADVAASIIAAADDWREMGAKIEGARRGALVGIAAHNTLLDLMIAARINWADLTD